MTKSHQTLDDRIRQMAMRWQYSPDELAEIREAAKHNYPAVRAFVRHDEQVFGACQTQADFRLAYLKHIAGNNHVDSTVSAT